MFVCLFVVVVVIIVFFFFFFFFLASCSFLDNRHWKLFLLKKLIALGSVDLAEYSPRSSESERLS